MVTPIRYILAKGDNTSTFTYKSYLYARLELFSNHVPDVVEYINPKP
jgi:hypothetical protein